MSAYRPGLFDNLAAHAPAAVTISYAPESLALFARMTVEPDAARKRRIDTLISDLKTAGLWDRLDVLYLFAAHDAQAALLNWKGPVADARLGHLSGTRDAQFTVDRGFKGDGTAQYIDTGYNPTTFAGAVYQRDDAHVTIWSVDDIAHDNYRDVGQLAPGPTGLCTVLNARSGSNALRGVVNAATSFGNYGTGTDARGMATFVRAGPQTTNGYVNGVFRETGGTASTGIPNANLSLLGDLSTAGRLSARGQAMMSAGAKRTGAQETIFYDLIRVYLAGGGLR